MTMPDPQGCSFYLDLMAFFIMSGYFYRPGRGFKANMMKRVKQLFIAISLCAIVLPVIQYGWLAILGQAPGFDDHILALQWGFGMNELFVPLGSPKVYPICGSAVGYYFLWIMLVAFVIFYGVIDHVIKDNRKMAAVIVILLAITALQCEFGRYSCRFTQNWHHCHPRSCSSVQRLRNTTLLENRGVRMEG